ncbi:hypothetical protein V8F20_000141 [Naviculisporaceae sp. PSN 640]
MFAITTVWHSPRWRYQRVNYFSTISSASDNEVVRGTAFLFVFSIFANLLAVIYTGPRVKQEIAKEGILPKSLLFASGTDSLYDRWFAPSTHSPYSEDGPPVAIAKEQVACLSPLLFWMFGCAYSSVWTTPKPEQDIHHPLAASSIRQPQDHQAC